MRNFGVGYSSSLTRIVIIFFSEDMYFLICDMSDQENRLDVANIDFV